MTNPVQETLRLGQSIWYDNVRRGLLSSGALRQLLDLGVTGVTSNPTILEKAIAGSTDYDEALRDLAVRGLSVEEIYDRLAVEDIQAVADLLLPVYQRTAGADGYVSLEVSPTLAHDTEGTINEARRLFSALGRQNAMIKVPATPEGIPAIRRLIALGINVNVTLIFSRDVYQKVQEAYIGGLEDSDRNGGAVSQVASVASFFVSRVDTAVDAWLESRIRDGQPSLNALLGKAAIANAKLAYQDFKGSFTSKRFDALRAKGARVQRPLWASTGAKNPAYSDLLYVESLIGPDTVNTVPPATLTTFLEHGKVEGTLESDSADATETLRALTAAGISLEQVTEPLLAEGVQAFAASFEKLLVNIQAKKSSLLASASTGAEFSLGAYNDDVEAALAELQQQDTIARIWRKDHTVWKPSPIEITDRLGWLTVTDTMCEQAPALEALGKEIKDAGFRHVVLLGMGGSSLGPEVLRQTFGSADGYPTILVLDSTVPAAVKAVADAIDPSRTLFLVSSKSGGTAETLSLYRYFSGLVAQSGSQTSDGSQFIAITDPGTSLHQVAEEQGFRRVFLNPSDIGGRYSVLSYFGLVPAALLGLDLAMLLDRADCLREGCASCVPPQDNPGARLGAVMGTLALRGRDKLTLVASKSITGFGLWVEQLLAESTGKEGKGIIPIAGEPLLDPAYYGNDRLFVYLRLEGDDNAATDTAVERLVAAEQPVVRLTLRDRYGLGAEFFRWEFATAVAGTFLGIHPFDQPSVQGAKDMTDRLLHAYQATGELPPPAATSSLKALLEEAKPGDYLAIMAYTWQTPEMDQALADLRQHVMERYRIATTIGYGPRFLHSTGQLHKGGPGSGLFLQIVTTSDPDITIPSTRHTFGILASAQAAGDLQALRAASRRVARAQVPADPSAIRRLAQELAWRENPGGPNSAPIGGAKRDD